MTPLLLLHAATIVLDNIGNSVQEVVSPITASTISIVNNSSQESVKVKLIISSTITGGNLTFRLSPGEAVDLGFGQRIINKVQVQACQDPTSTIEDNQLVVKTGNLYNTSNTKHLISVKFLGEKIVDPTKTCV